MALFGASLVARRRKARVAGRSLAALGDAVSVAAARLGGNLVYEQKIGVDRSDPEKLPDKFTPVLSESNLPDEKPVRVDHNGTPILLVRRGSQIYALAETCSHLGGPLSEGKLEEEIIQCPWQGSRFSIRDGGVIDGPAVHPQPCLEARIRSGQSGSPIAGLPHKIKRPLLRSRPSLNPNANSGRNKRAGSTQTRSGLAECSQSSEVGRGAERRWIASENATATR